MKQLFFSNTSPWFKLSLLIFIALACLSICILFGTILSIFIFDIGLNEIPTFLENINNPENVSIIKYFQIVQSFGLFIIPPIIMAIIINKNPVHYLRVNTRSDITIFIIAGITTIMTMPIINVLLELNSKMVLPEFLSNVENWMIEKEEAAENITRMFITADNTRQLIYNLFIVAVLPAIGEELIFRGVIQRLFIEGVKNIHWGVFITAIFFSWFHFQFYGFLPRLALGIFLGYLFVWSKNIWVPIFAHFINNGVMVTAYYYLDEKIITEKIEEAGTNLETLWYLIASIIIVGGLMVLFKRMTANSAYNKYEEHS